MKNKFKNLLSIIIFTVCACGFITGCNNQQTSNETNISGGWEIDDITERSIISDDALNAYNNSGANKKNYQLVALLGKQIVSGTNYMFLVEDNSTYKVLVIYNNLENKATITSTTNFDITKYVNNNIDYEYKNLSGGWYVEVPSKGVMLEEEVQAAFDSATNEENDITYVPIGVMAHQLVSGTNYAILTYGKLNNFEEKNAIYLITLYKDLKGNSKIVSSAYIDLSDFNN